MMKMPSDYGRSRRFQVIMIHLAQMIWGVEF